MPPPPGIARGTCYATFAYDVAPSIDLEAVERASVAAEEHRVFRPRRGAPAYFEYRPSPLRVVKDVRPLPIGDFHTAPLVEMVCYDFGAVSVTYAIPIAGQLTHAAVLSGELYDNPALRAEARHNVDDLLRTMHLEPSSDPGADLFEEYVVFHVEEWETPLDPADLLRDHAQLVAQLLRSEQRSLSEQEIADATASHVSVGRDDLAIIDWNTALLVGPVGEEVRAVIEFANVQLLELRYLDNLLDRTLDRLYDVLSRRRVGRLLMFRSYEIDLRQLARLQVDNTLLFERVTNALKLLGEQSISRTYRLVASRLFLDEWYSSVTRRLRTADSLYHTLADWAAGRRVELLEIIVIVLIAAEILISVIGR